MGELQVRHGVPAEATGIPSKSIILWPLPFDKNIYPQLNGYILCDGSNGTPDMRTYFVRGAPAACTDVIIDCWGCAECSSAIGGCACCICPADHCHVVYIPDVEICVLNYCRGPATFDVLCVNTTTFCTCTCPLSSEAMPPYKNMNFIMKL